MPAILPPTRLNTLQGDVTLAAGSNVTVTPSGNTLTIASSGGASATTVVSVTGTSKTLGLSDANTIQDCSNAAAQALAIPTNAAAAIPVNSVIQVEQNGAGPVGVTAAAGVTLNGVDGGSVQSSGQYSSFYLRKEDTNVWYASSLGYGALGVTALGSSAAAASPQRAGEANTGLYTAGSGRVNVAVSGNQVADFSAAGLNVSTTNANALSVSAGGSAVPAFSVDTTVTNFALGVRAVPAVAFGTATVTPLDAVNGNGSIRLRGLGTGSAALSADTSALTLSSSGSASLTATLAGSTALTLNGAQFSGSASRLVLAALTDSGLTASTDVPIVRLAFAGTTRTHATGTLATQSDVLITGGTDAFAAASTLANAATVRIGLKNAGTNATFTNGSGIYVPSAAVTGTVGSSFGVNAEAATGATNNYAARFQGPVLYAGSAPAIAAGTGAGTGPTVGVVGTPSGGTITVTTGTSPAASNATVATLTWPVTFPTGSAPVLSPANAAAAALSGATQAFMTGTTTTGVLTGGSSALAASTTYAWNYRNLGY